MNPTSGNPFGSAFGAQGMSFGGGASGNMNNPSGSAFASTAGASAFGHNGGGSNSPNAFGGFGASNSNNSGASAFNHTANTNGGTGTFFNSATGHNTFNTSTPNQSQGQYGTFDASGNIGGYSDGSRGRGRGRGNSSYRGGRGGGNRGSANLTYVAPRLSTTQGQQHQPHANSQLSSVFNAGSPEGDSDSAFAAAGSNRGRGGYSGNPRGRGRGAAGVSGQFRSMQWRADSAQNSANQGSDSAMAMDDASDMMNGTSSSAFNTGSTGGASILHQQTALSGFGSISQSRGFGQQAGQGFASTSANKQWTAPAPSAIPVSGFQVNGSGSAVGTQTSTPAAGTPGISAFSSAGLTTQGLTTSAFGKEGLGKGNTPNTQGDSVFAVPTSRPAPSPSTARPSKSAFKQPAKSPLSEDRFTPRPDFNKLSEDANSRAVRFSGDDKDRAPGSSKMDHSRAVKKYPRSEAGAEPPLPSDVRPPEVLLSTLDYLIKEVASEGDLADSHGFVRDRTRSIRMDFTLQNSRGIEAVQAHEIIARYHILCIHQLCELTTFNNQQEMEQLRKVLMSLQEFYDDLRAEGIPCPNEAEFRAYHILSHLRDPDMIRQAQRLPLHIFQDPYIQVAAEMHALTRRNNDFRRRAKVQSEASPNFFSRFFKLVAGPATTYLMACILETYFVEIRKGALKALNKCYLEQHGGIPVEELATILGFDDADECITNCTEYGLELANPYHSAVVFGKKDPSTRRRIFKEDAVALAPHRNERIVEVKRQDYTTAQIIYGQTPSPHQGKAIPIMARSIASTTSGSVAVKPYPGLTSASASLRQSTTPSATPGFSTSIPPPALATIPQPTAGVRPGGIFSFGLDGSSTSQPNGITTSAVATQGLSVPSVFSAAAAATLGTAAGVPLFTPGFTSSSSTQPLPGQLSAPNTRQPVSSALNPGAADFKPAGLTFLAPPNSAATISTTSTLAPTPSSAVSTSTATPAQPSVFTFKAPAPKSPAPANLFAFKAPNQTPPPPSVSLSSSAVAPILGGVFTSALKMPSTLNISSPLAGTPVQPPTPTRSSLFTAPPPLSPASTPKSDATRIVTKRGRIYPRSLVESVMKELLDSETDRTIRMTAAYMSHEVVLERTVRRAKQRQEALQRETMRILTEVMTLVASETTQEILAEIFREKKVQRRVVAHWKEFTIKSIQQAEELRRRQEHFLNNVRAMGSRAGLADAEPWMVKIRDQNSTKRLSRTGRGSGQTDLELQGIKAMVASNKRKRLLSIGQEGSPDLALVAGLKKAVAPKQEMWAPLPVLEIVQSRYNKATATGDTLSADQQPSRKPGGLTKRRWRLFVDTPSFKQTTSKWLLMKLGIDMSRTTKTQQRSGTMVAEHSGPSSSEIAMDVIVHGSEDASVMGLLGMSKYEIMETAAFMFEFSKIPFTDDGATEQAIRQYWLSERARLVRYLSCFPKVKQPIVFILWTSAPEVWERVSPRMVEYLELDAMVKSPQGPLLGYRFLNMDMSTMKLDRFVTGSLEWLATETKDYFEDPAAMLSTLLDKYRPIFEWALCRISLAEGPCYSQYDEEDEEETNRWLLKQKQRKKIQEQMLLYGGGSVGSGEQIGGDLDQLLPPRNLFVESTETGFNLAVRLFNMELESIAQTIEAKGQGETREGAAQEGRVKDAMARFIRQAQLPEMKLGSILDRVHYGMEPKGAFRDFMDDYSAKLGGLAKEPQNLEAKAAMRAEIWDLFRSSTEDRVPLETIFKRISSQVLTWIEAGILDTERFSIRLKKWESQRNALERQQNQYRRQRLQLDSIDWEDEGESDVNGNHRTGRHKDGSSDVAFTPFLIHDEVDVDGNVFDFEMTAQSEVRDWERVVERLARDRELKALAVPVETSSLANRTGLTVPSAHALGASRFGDSRKRRAPESPRDTLKKSRMQMRSTLGPTGDDDDGNLFLTSATASRPSSPPNGAAVNGNEIIPDIRTASPGLVSSTAPWSFTSTLSPLSRTVSPASGTHTPALTVPVSMPIASVTVGPAQPAPTALPPQQACAFALKAGAAYVDFPKLKLQAAADSGIAEANSLLEQHLNNPDGDADADADAEGGEEATRQKTGFSAMDVKNFQAAAMAAETNQVPILALRDANECSDACITSQGELPEAVDDVDVDKDADADKDADVNAGADAEGNQAKPDAGDSEDDAEDTDEEDETDEDAEEDGVEADVLKKVVKRAAAAGPAEMTDDESDDTDSAMPNAAAAGASQDKNIAAGVKKVLSEEEILVKVEFCVKTCMLSCARDLRAEDLQDRRDKLDALLQKQELRESFLHNRHHTFHHHPSIPIPP
ncbi:hypothetical protein BGX33_009375 [Mortierella sp. NVP41]|nr:hypothetical protein BGX33_009375 [Mortierella sp. NVP41]